VAAGDVALGRLYQKANAHAKSRRAKAKAVATVVGILTQKGHIQIWCQDSFN